ncbi:MAG: flagellar export chaperone FliS [Oscillospiraceae bacterium]|nr:flagellar export chaperone FliS [Oscillospiraceae bacterium]
MVPNPYQKFMKQSVSTMRPGELLLALYDKAIVELNRAIIFIENKDIPNAHNSIIRVKDIVEALDSSLKVRYEVTENLAALYQYFYKLLISANIKKDPQILSGLIPYFVDLRNTFAEADKIA